jgi:hypothetical protein
VPPKNATCPNAQNLTIPSSGTQSVPGSTAGLVDEYQTTPILCGATSGSLAHIGPQVYYRLNLTANTTYRFTLSPAYYGTMYLFGDHCNASQINADCASKGINGDVTSTIAPSTSGTITFKPSSTRHVRLAVDSRGRTPAYYGTFTLTITR